MTYGGGNACNAALGQSYQSVVKYVCDKRVEFGRPQLVEWPGMHGKKDFEGSQWSCTFVFEWRSRLACSQCTVDQVEQIQGACDGEYRKVQTVPKPNQVC